MKKVIALILTLCTLLCTLTACKSRRENIIEKYSDTDAESDTLTGTSETGTDTTPGRKSYYHGENPYAGMTPEELTDLYWDNFRINIQNNVSWNTPYYVIHIGEEKTSAFSKLTGEIVSLCKDPLCDHKDCLFGRGMYGFAVAEDRIYAIMKTKDGKYVMYSFDYSFNDPQELYTWTNKNDLPIDSRIFYTNGKLYYAANYVVDKKAVMRVKVFDTATNTDSWLTAEDDDRISHFYGVYEDYAYYRRPSSSDIWRLNLNTGEDVCVVPRTQVNPDDGPADITLTTVEPGSQVLLLWVFRYQADGLVIDDFEYHVDTKEMVKCEKSINRIGDLCIFYQKHYNGLECFKNDPYYDYYKNDFDQSITKTINFYGGDLYTTGPDELTLKHLVRITLDGIPICLEPENFGFITDGKCVYVKFCTYKSYKNKYNPNPRKITTEEKAANPDPDAYTFYNNGWLVIDVENQNVLTISHAELEFDFDEDEE